MNIDNKMKRQEMLVESSTLINTPIVIPPGKNPTLIAPARIAPRGGYFRGYRYTGYGIENNKRNYTPYCSQ